MTTLDPRAVEAAIAAVLQYSFVSTETGAEAVSRLAITAYLDALSSLPAQAVDLRTLVPGFRLDWSGLRNRFEDDALRLEKLTTYESRAAYLDEMARQFEDAVNTALAPSQPAAVGVTDEMVEIAARAIFETWAKTEGSTMTWADAVAACETPDAFPKMSKIVPLCRSEARAALEAALVHRDQVKL